MYVVLHFCFLYNRHVVDLGCIAPLCGMLYDPRGDVVERTLDGLSLLLYAGRRRQCHMAVVAASPEAGNPEENGSNIDVNPYLEEVGRAARERLLALHGHESESVADKAYRVLQEFFNSSAT